jgi:hypothetical protein
MADHTDHKLTRYTLRWTELGSVDAVFLHRAGGASPFVRDLLNTRGEEHFTPILRGALHRSLHRSASGKARQVNPIDVSKTVGLRAGWNDVMAGATPPFDARCFTVAVGSLPPQSRAARDPFGRVPEPEFRSCQTTFITPRKSGRKDKELINAHAKQPKTATCPAW